MKSYDGENADITKDIIACAIEVHKTLGGPSWQHLKAGKESAEESRSKPPSTLPAQTSVFQNRNGDV